ncbi:TPR Domain containing protein [Trypanosoma conorhini]|uniref:TPR Domain containing protein n=1 Tax=Trypanosoma conorhini TaxID=83891 RepID=A0A3R7L1J9_9TRYP|nr:TPR Domain containing protein [Trypanosoma conorhini]RNF05740.1 TPR Domain containing protein [Trypanosoma conorhini]
MQSRSLVPPARTDFGGGGEEPQQEPRGQQMEGEKTIVSSTRKKYTILPSASHRLLDTSSLRAMERYIALNRTHRFSERDGPPARVIPELPFQRLYDGDEVLHLAVKTVRARESALDVPLRFITPEEFHAPPLEDPPTNLPLARRVAALLKGAESVPVHWMEQRPGAVAAAGVDDSVVVLKVMRDAISRGHSAIRAGNTKEGAHLFCTAASLHYNSGNMELARSFFAKALSAFELIGDVRGISFCHNILGVCYYRLREFKVSLLHHKRQGSLGGCYSRAVSQINMGVSYAALGELNFAESALEDALANARTCESSLLETIALGNQGLVHLRMGNMRVAQTDLEQCLEKCSLGGDKSGAAICLLLLGELYSLIHDHQHALFYYEHAYRVGGEADCPDVVDVARVSIGIARGNAALRDAVILQAKRMGQQIDLKDVLALLPP